MAIRKNRRHAIAAEMWVRNRAMKIAAIKELVPDATEDDMRALVDAGIVKVVSDGEWMYSGG